jgi:hypothetical protein
MCAVALRCVLDQVREFGFSGFDSNVDQFARPHDALVHAPDCRGPLILSRVAVGPLISVLRLPASHPIGLGEQRKPKPVTLF